MPNCQWWNQGCGIFVFFCGTPTPDSGTKKLLHRLQLQDLLCDIKIMYVRMTWKKFINSSNKRCTVVYKQSFCCKLYYTKVKQTATKLHKSPDKTDNARSQSLLQMRDSKSGPKPELWGPPTPTPHPWIKQRSEVKKWKMVYCV